MSADIPTTKILENDEISWPADIGRLEVRTSAHEELYYLSYNADSAGRRRKIRLACPLLSVSTPLRGASERSINWRKPERLKTALLLGALTGLIMLIGQWLGGTQGMVIAFVFAVLMNFGSYWFSDKIVLAAYGAREVNEAEAPTLYRIVHNLALRDGIPMPRLYIIPSQAANAFATGRNPQHAAVAVTEGMLRLMNERELTGVLAHELSHVRNRDILISTIAATLAGVVMMIANMARWGAIFGGMQRDDSREGGGGIISLIAMSILAPIAAMIIQMAVSRTREYEADETGARISGDPVGLASALEKLAAAAEQIPLDASPQTSHLFIVNPLSGRSFMQLFSTHPPLEERIARLLAMAGRRT